MDKFIAHLNVNGSTVDIACDTLDALIEMTNRVSGTASAVIKPIDAPDAGADTKRVVVDMQQTAAALAFGGARTPEQQILDHAVGATPPAPMPGLPESLLTPQVDSEGVRWDARIHSSTKTTVASGAWRMRKGVDQALVDQVKAEQRALASLPPVPVEPIAVAAPPVPVVPLGDGVIAAAHIVSAPIAAPVPPVPVAVAAPPVPAPQAEQITDFGKFCEWLNGPMLTVPPKLTLDDVTNAVKKFGMNALPDLLQRADYIPVVHGELAALVKSR